MVSGFLLVNSPALLLLLLKILLDGSLLTGVVYYLALSASNCFLKGFSFAGGYSFTGSVF